MDNKEFSVSNKSDVELLGSFEVEKLANQTSKS